LRGLVADDALRLRKPESFFTAFLMLGVSCEWSVILTRVYLSANSVVVIHASEKSRGAEKLGSTSAHNTHERFGGF